MEAGTHNLQTDRQRNKYLDIVKAVAIICVVFGHCIQYGSGQNYLANGLFFDNVVFKVIYSFHMPVFMLVSGYLFAFSRDKQNWTDAIVHKIKTLFMPIILWSLIPFSVSLFASWYHGNEGLTVLLLCKKFISTVLENLWFLWAIFWCSLVVILVNRFLKNSKIVYLFGLGLTFFIPDLFGSQLYRFMYPFFILGYFCNIEGVIRKYKRIYSTNTFFYISGVAFILLLTQYGYESYIYTSGYYLFKGQPLHQLYIDIYRFVIGLIGSIFVMLVIAKLEKSIPPKLVAALLCVGKNSLGIYIISGFFFSYVLNRITYSLSTVNYFITLIETILILAFSLVATMQIKKSSMLNKLLLGGRL